MAYTTIDKSTDYFNTKLYTGNGSVRTETGVGFQPDWVWIKDRDGSNAHVLTDSVRGANYQVYSNLTNTQTNASGYLTAFASDGFTLGTDGAVNTNSNTYVSWNWKAGTTGSGNTSGSGTYKTYNYSVNTTAGFSIVKYTGNGTAGQTIPHHLGAVPKLIILKPLQAADNWRVYHIGIDATAPEDYHLQLQSNGPRSDNANIWNDTAPTSTVFTIGSDSGVNTDNQTFIAYCFAEKTGYSRIGKYTGNENTDGTFVYTGFKPAFVLFKKNTGSNADWQLWDNKRDPSNPVERAMHPNASGGASTDQDIDFLSNGFKLRSNASHLNANGVVFSYVSFGQSIVGSNNIPATAF